MRTNFSVASSYLIFSNFVLPSRSWPHYTSSFTIWNSDTRKMFSRKIANFVGWYIMKNWEAIGTGSKSYPVVDFATKRKIGPVTDPGGGGRGFQGVKFPRFRDNGSGWWYVVSLTHRPPLPSGIEPRTIVRSGGLWQWKNSNETTWNRNSNLPICSTAP